ncbi:MAG: DUF480 domain-containing protein [Gammaproteobacteria bacterium]|nr:DUF480 domain-containing protein [Gammaproteobacteria bacterium]
MANPNLTVNEIRIVGCLMEKAVTTPEQFPLTLNALTLACNQKSSRDPVLSLDQDTVRRTARMLEDKGLVTREENFRTGVTKYRQRFCNTPFSDQQFTPEEYAVICVLLLRGSQTPGELRTRTARMHAFADNEAVSATLAGLLDSDREGGAVAARLPRVPGRRDHEYMHLFAGEIDSVPEEERTASQTTPRLSRLDELEARVQALEAELAALKQDLSA